VTSNTRGTRGASFLEILLVVSLSAMLVVGAASYFRTLRQVSDLAHKRREALQNARVVLERIVRRIRPAKQIVAITPEAEPAGSITIRDFDEVNYVFALQGTEVYYGIDAATDLLATAVQSLRFQGYSSEGPRPPEEPAGIEAVQISISTAIPGTLKTIDLTTRVRLRRDVDFNQVRSTTSYASAYEKTLGGGLSNPSCAFGAPDDNYALCREDDGGRYYGFDTGQHTGEVQSIYAGLRVNRIGGLLQVIVRHDTTILFDRSYTEEELDPVSRTWGWWWIDLSGLQAGWTDQDIDNLSIEVRDPGTSGTKVRFDSFAILAAFDAVQTSLFWADREGGGACPNEWTNASNALGEPDDLHATGQWNTEDWQSFAFPVPDSNDLIVTIHLLLECYLSSSVALDELEIRTAPPADNPLLGPEHVLIDELNAYVGPANEGTLEVDLTNDRPWVWDDLETHEVRFHLDRNGDPDTFRTLHVDAVGWRVVHRAPPERGIRIWSEP